MRVLLRTAGALLLSVSAASAADLPVKAPPAIAPALYDWTGFYVGLAGGGGWGSSDHEITKTHKAVDDFDVSGGLFGGTAGYNWQWGQAVFGVEGDASYAWLHGSTRGNPPGLCGPPAASCTTKLRGFETLRLRFGYAWDRWMPYLTGGLALGQIRGEIDPRGNSGSTTRAGWTVGAGIEWAFAPRWSAKLEYLFADFGTEDALFVRQPGAFPFDVSLNTNIVRVGVNYKF